MHYEIYFSSHFLFVVIRTSACASANDRKENDEKNKSHNARETCVNWVIAWTKKTCPAKQINRRKFSPPCEFGCSTPQSSLASLLLLFVLKKLVHHDVNKQKTKIFLLLNTLILTVALRTMLCHFFWIPNNNKSISWNPHKETKVLLDFNLCWSSMVKRKSFSFAVFWFYLFALRFQ